MKRASEKKTFYEKARELSRQARNERDPKIKKEMIRAIKNYWKADVKMKGNKKNDVLIDIVVVIIFYIVIVGSAIAAFKLLNAYEGVAVIIGTFALCCLMMGVVLRIRGDIEPSDLITMIKEGFKALVLLRKKEGNDTKTSRSSKGGKTKKK